MTSGTTRDIWSVHFPADDSTGYAVGEEGTILKTTDGGESWNFQTTSATRSLICAHFPPNGVTGYAVGLNGAIVKTTSGGIPGEGP